MLRHFDYDRGFYTFFDGLRFVGSSRLPEMATSIYSKIILLLRRFPYKRAKTIIEQAVDWLAEWAEMHRRSSGSTTWIPTDPTLINDRGYIVKFRSERLWRKAVTDPAAVLDAEFARLRES